MAYHFLTDEWIEAAKEIRDEYESRLSNPPASIKLNVVITDSPHHDGNINGHVDSSAGSIIIEEGHVPDADVTVTLDYQTAQAIFVSRDPQVLMQAIFGGKILVEGDASSLLMLQAQAPTADAAQMYQRLEDITTGA